MKRSSLRSLLPLVLAFFFISGSGEVKRLPVIHHKDLAYLSLHDLTAYLSLDSAYDNLFFRGRLLYRSHTAVFGVGNSYVILDGALEKAEYPVKRLKGEVLIPLVLACRIMEKFYPEKQLVVSETDVSLRPADKKEKPGISGEPEKKAVHDRDNIGFIIIDPGHGGKDPGAVGRGGLREKAITLAVAKYTAASLRERFKNIPVYLTRKTDRFLELYERTDIANKYLKKNKNGLFVSIHVNASLSPRISGFETYFLSQNPSNEEARNTAALENNVIVLEDKSGKGKKFEDVDYIEAAMLTTQIQKESSKLADEVLRGLMKENSSFKTRGVRKADFYVLRGALMPASLVEVGFITNKKDSDKIRDPGVQKKIARGIAEGLHAFIRKYNRQK